MRKNFDYSLKSALQHEGGYVDHPRDPGGATNLGVTIKTLSAWRGRPVSKNEVKKLTLEEAGQIYRRQYWDTVAGDDLPAGVDYAVFDFSVNSGPSRAARTLQAVVGVTADGIIGAQTLAAVRRMSPVTVVEKICERRMAFLRNLDTFSTFGNGWTRRVNDVRRGATALARQNNPPPNAGQGPTPKAPEPAPTEPVRSKSLWAMLISALSGIGGVFSFGSIDNPYALAAFGLIIVALAIGGALVATGRVKLEIPL